MSKLSNIVDAQNCRQCEKVKKNHSKELKQLENKLENSARDSKKLSERIESLEELKKSLQERIVSSLDKSDFEMKAKNALESSLQKKNKEIKILLSKLKEAEISVKALSSENKGLKMTISSNSSQIQDDLMKKRYLGLEKEKAEEKLSKISGNINSLNELNLNLNINLSQLEEKNEKLEKKLSLQSEDNKIMIITLQSKVKFLTEKNKELNSKTIIEQKKYAELKKSSKSFETKNKLILNLKNELVKLKSEIEKNALKLKETEENLILNEKTTEEMAIAKECLTKQVQELYTENKSLRIAGERRLEEREETMKKKYSIEFEKQKKEIEILEDLNKTLRDKKLKKRTVKEDLEGEGNNQRENMFSDLNENSIPFDSSEVDFEYLKNVMISFLRYLPLNERVAKQLLPVIGSIMHFSKDEKSLIESSWEDFLLWGLNKPIFVEKLQNKK